MQHSEVFPFVISHAGSEVMCAFYCTGYSLSYRSVHVYIVFIIVIII